MPATDHSYELKTLYRAPGGERAQTSSSIKREPITALGANALNPMGADPRGSGTVARHPAPGLARPPKHQLALAIRWRTPYCWFHVKRRRETLPVDASIQLARGS